METEEAATIEAAEVEVAALEGAIEEIQINLHQIPPDGLRHVMLTFQTTSKNFVLIIILMVAELTIVPTR